jgi:Na+-driven multidrug efflux pump
MFLGDVFLSKTRIIDMTRGPLFRNIISYTLPIMLTGFLQLLFNAADLIIVGQFCGSISVAAVGATGAITNLIVNLFIGLSVASNHILIIHLNNPFVNIFFYIFSIYFWLPYYI